MSLRIWMSLTLIAMALKSVRSGTQRGRQGFGLWIQQTWSLVWAVMRPDQVSQMLSGLFDVMCVLEHLLWEVDAL